MEFCGSLTEPFAIQLITMQSVYSGVGCFRLILMAKSALWKLCYPYDRNRLGK